MKVALVSLTKSMFTLEQEITPEQLIVYIARVSNPTNQMNHETADKLIAFLVKNKHWSPMEMVDMCVEIVTSRVVAQQILRHRSFSFQEFSQRYAEVTEMEEIQMRYQADKNRQSSTDEISQAHKNKYEGRIQDHIYDSQALYKELLKDGIAKECARFVLPLTTQTTIYMKGSVRSWIHYLQIRCGSHTQLEHRQVAIEIKKIFAENFPEITKALEL